MDKYNIPLLFESFCILEDTIWISARDFNGLFKGDLKSGKIEYIGTFPGEDIAAHRLHYGEAICVKQIIYFIPLESKRIHTYDLRTGVFGEKEILTGTGYAKGIQFDNKLYLLSTRKTDILEYNLDDKTYKVVFKTDIIKEYGYSHGSCMIDQYIFMMLAEENVLRRFDMLTYQVKDYVIGNIENRYQIVARKDCKIFFINKNEKEVFCWDSILSRIVEKKRLKYQIKLNSWYQDNIVLGNASLGDGIIVLDIKNLTVDKFFISREDHWKKWDGFEIQNAFLYNDDMYFIWSGDMNIYSLSNKKRTLQFIIPDHVFLELCDRFKNSASLHKQDFFVENMVISLENFIHYIQKRN